MSTAAAPPFLSYGEAGGSWIREGDRQLISVVFVHGWTGDFDKTWNWKPSLCYRCTRGIRNPKKPVHLIRDLLLADSEIACDVFTFGHNGGLLDKSHIDEFANALKTFIDNYVVRKAQGRHIVLVAHSLGGLICRKVILDYLKIGPAKRPVFLGLLMYGCPNSGTQLANLRYRIPLPEFVRSMSAKGMEPLNKMLTDINRDWLDKVVNSGNPDIAHTGRCKLLSKAVFGLRDWVVSAPSAISLSNAAETASLVKGHSKLVKAASKNDHTYVMLKNFLAECQKLSDEWILRNRRYEFSEQMREWAQGKLDGEKTPWTIEEHDIIELAYAEPAGTGGKGGLLECNVSSTRVGGIVYKDFIVCLSLQDQQPSGKRFDYHHILGEGILPDDEYESFVGMLKNKSITESDFEAIFRIDHVKLIVDGEDSEHVYKFKSLKHGWGHAVLTLECDLSQSEIDAIGRRNTLDILLRCFVHRRHGWYTFFSTRTVLKRLELELIAPFKVTALPFHWWHTLKDPVEGRIEMGRYKSTIDLDGPVPAETCVNWVFGVDGASASSSGNPTRREA